MTAMKSFLGSLADDEKNLACAFRDVSMLHSREADVRYTCEKLARWSDTHLEALEPILARYGRKRSFFGVRLRDVLFRGVRLGGTGLVRDLMDLSLLNHRVRLLWNAVLVAAQALRDEELEALCRVAGGEADRQMYWLRTRLRSTAPQALTVSPAPLAALQASLPKVPSLRPLGARVGRLQIAVIGVIAGAIAFRRMSTASSVRSH